MTTTNPIVLLAPAPNMVFAGMPSGATYVSNPYGLITITNGSVADQAALVTGGGCLTLTAVAGVTGNPSVGATTLAGLYALDAANDYAEGTIAAVFNDGTVSNNGLWAKTSAGTGSGNWTFEQSLFAVQSALVSPNVVANIVSAPTGSETAGTLYIVSASPSGAFMGQANAVACLNVFGVWQFTAPVVGQKLYVQASGQHYTYLSGAWTLDGVPSAVTQFAADVAAATTGALPSNTYSNGTAGVGATLTGTANGAFPTIDGVAAALNNRYWVINETAATNNGIYSLTQVGSGSTPYILTRTTDADTPALLGGMAAFVNGGTTNIGNTYAIQLPAASITIGTTALTPVLIGGPGGVAAEASARAAAVASEASTRTTEDNILLGQNVSQGVSSPSAGSGTAGANYTWFGNAAISNTGALESVSLYASASGYVTLVLVSFNSGNTEATLQASQVVAVTEGLNTITNWNPAVEAGWYIGVYSTNAPATFQSGESGYTLYYTSGLPSTNTSLSTDANFELQLGWTVTTGIAGEALRANAVIAEDITGQSIIQGVSPPTAASGTSGAGQTWFGNAPISNSGQLSSISLYAGSPGSVTLVLASFNSGNTEATIQDQQTVNVSAGLNTISNWNPLVEAGWYLGVYSETAPVNFLAGATGFTLYHTSGIPGVGTALTTVANYDVQLDWTINTGVANQINALNENVNAIEASGFGLLELADPTGNTDATPYFVGAWSQNTAPNVPAGNFTVSSMPTYSAGFWGEGKITNNGVRHFTPRKPSGSLLLGTRSRFAQLISSGSPLIFVGDSLTSGIKASVQANAWPEKLLAFLNESVGASGSYVGNSLMTGAGDDNTAARYGFSETGTITNGTNGPINASTILASGASLTLINASGSPSVALSEIGIFYTQQSGAGSIQVTYNGGSPFINQSAAGATALDQYVSAATGESAAGEYVITAVGGSVELTGVVRLAPISSTAGTPNQLITMRYSHGGYETSNFGTTQYTSQIAQAAALAGGSPKFGIIVFLGINDAIANGDPATSYITNLTAEINAWIAGGAAFVDVMGLIRPTFSQHSSGTYTADVFDTYIAAQRQVVNSFRSNACPVRFCPLDHVDFSGLGLLYSDGLHPNDLGNDRIVQEYLEWGTTT